MIPAAELARAARAALEQVSAWPEVREAEVFVAATASLLARLNYTSHIPCNGVEEPKSVESLGLGIQAVFDGPGGPLVGFGSEPSDLTPAGVERALARARATAVADPSFVCLPRSGRAARGPAPHRDPRLVELDDLGLVEAGWRVVEGAVRTFLTSTRLAGLAGSDQALRRLGLVVGGDVTVLQERMALASTAMPEPVTDESTRVTAFVTAMVEAYGAKGSGWSVGTRLDELTDEAGCEAARRAIDAVGGQRVASGQYTVVLGPQPVADLLDNLVIPALTARAFYASSTPFRGRLGRPVAVSGLGIYDHGALPGLAGSRGVTCEGLPTGRTDLVRDGVLVGCLASWYEAQRLLRDPDLAAKLGVAGPAAEAALVPRNGFRLGPDGARRFDARPGIEATNVVVEGADPLARDELLRRVRDGLYIGRIWYTYPINGLAAGDFTCSVVGDSYIIRDGRLAAPLKANAIRINDNVTRILRHVVGVGKDAKGTVLWASSPVVYAPEIAVSGVPVDEIAGFMEELS